MVQVVFRVLYKKTYTLGVPMPVIVGEIFLAVILMLAFGWYWFALICIAFHIALASLLGKDSEILWILSDVLFLPVTKESKKHEKK